MVNNMKNNKLALWLSGGFGSIAVWHLLMALSGITASFPSLGITLTRELHLLIFVISGFLSVLLYKCRSKKKS